MANFLISACILLTGLAANADYVLTQCRGPWQGRVTEYPCEGATYVYGYAMCETIDSRRIPNNTSHGPRSTLLFCSKANSNSPTDCDRDSLPATMRCFEEYERTHGTRRTTGSRS